MSIRPPVPVLRVMVAEMGQHLIERLPPGSVAPFGEVTARLAGPSTWRCLVRVA